VGAHDPSPVSERRSPLLPLSFITDHVDFIIRAVVRGGFSLHPTVSRAFHFETGYVNSVLFVSSIYFPPLFRRA